MLKTPKERISHLLRRIGYGAGSRELSAYLPLGEQGTLDRLLNFGPATDSHPLRFIWPYSKEEEIQPGTWRFRPWWISQMMMSEAPLRERLTIFWHDHFAVSDGKVEDGLAMLDYMQALRKDPSGKFKDILKNVVTTPAFLKYLDVRMTSKARPNENFAREVLELYTLGIGHYTEQDIKECSRALTGWSWMNVFYEMPGTMMEKMRNLAEHGEVFHAFAYMPNLHDSSEKTILGKKGNFDGFELLDRLSVHTQTAQHLCRKLWEHFVYEEPDDRLIDRLAKPFTKSDGSIKELLNAMVQQPEFWSEKAVNSRIKSPFDLCASIFRSMGQQEVFRKELDPAKPWNDPVPQKCMESFAGMGYQMTQMGFDLLYPDDVDGWNWGKGWLSPNNMPHRTKFAGIMTWEQESKDKWVPSSGLKPTLEEMKKVQQGDIHAFVDRFCEIFDAPLNGEAAQALRDFFEKRNYKHVTEKDTHLGWLITQAISVLCATPSFQTH